MSYCVLLHAYSLLMTVRARCDYTVKHLAQPLAHGEHLGDVTSNIILGVQPWPATLLFTLVRAKIQANIQGTFSYVHAGRNASDLGISSSIYSRSLWIFAKLFQSSYQKDKEVTRRVNPLCHSQHCQPDLHIHFFTPLPFKRPCPRGPIAQPPSLLQTLWVWGEGREPCRSILNQMPPCRKWVKRLAKLYLDTGRLWILVLFWSINIPNSSEHTICFNNVVGLHMMNLCKDGENVKIASQSYNILMLSVLLLLGFPALLYYKLSNFFFLYEGIFLISWISMFF